MSNSKFSPPPIPADSWCRTREDSVHHTFVWTIEQFSQRKEKVDEAIESAKFSVNRQAYINLTFSLVLFFVWLLFFPHIDQRPNPKKNMVSALSS
jgi:hypothetical protein